MAQQLKRVVEVMEGVDEAAYRWSPDAGPGEAHEALRKIHHQLKEALTPPPVIDPPRSPPKPDTVTVARAAWTYEQMFQQMIERANQAGAGELGVAVRQALEVCRDNISRSKLGPTTERLRFLAEEAAHCIVSTGVNEEEIANYLTDFLAEILKEVLLGAPKGEDHDGAPAAQAGP